MYAQINIGMDISNTDQLRVPLIVRTLHENFITPFGWRVSPVMYDGRIEHTYIARVHLDTTDSVHTVSEALGQDCIAVQYEDGSGELIGPNTAPYGEFNPDYFEAI